MARRVNSELLLVGSLPADSTETALRDAAGLFGDLVFALPDGETGPRAGWVSYERERLARPNPGIVVLQETESPTGLPRHAYETPVFGVRPGVTELRFDSWPRIDDAIESYAVFSKLQLYSPWGYPYVCVEPVTNANDGFNRAAIGVAGHGVVALEPGRRLEGGLRIALA